MSKRLNKTFFFQIVLNEQWVQYVKFFSNVNIFFLWRHKIQNKKSRPLGEIFFCCFYHRNSHQKSKYFIIHHTPNERYKWLFWLILSEVIENIIAQNIVRKSSFCRRMMKKIFVGEIMFFLKCLFLCCCYEIAKLQNYSYSYFSFSFVLTNPKTRISFLVSNVLKKGRPVVVIGECFLQLIKKF